MADKKGARPAAASLEAKAREALARLAGPEELAAPIALEGKLPSTGATLHRFQAFPKRSPNGPPFTVVLDEELAEVDVERLSEADRAALFAPPEASAAPRERAAASALRRITLDPAFNDLVLDPGEVLHEIVKVTVPKSDLSPIDVYFLADSTGSMVSAITAVQGGANAMLNALAGLGFDMAFGVGNYKDFPNPPNAYVFQHQQTPTKVISDVANAINSWTAGDGGPDGAEGQFFALQQLAQPPGGKIGWRAGTRRILVWIGDAPGHDPVCSALTGLPFDITEDSVTAKLVGEGITVLALSLRTGILTEGLDESPVGVSGGYQPPCLVLGGTAGQGSRIAAATGGTYLKLEPPFDTAGMVTAILGLVKKAVGQIDNLRLVPAGAIAPFVAAIAPAGGYGPLAFNLDFILPFEVDWKGVQDCTDLEQDFEGTLDVVADGKVVAQKRVRIVVPPCRVYSYSVKFVCGRQESCACGEAPVRPGLYTTEINLYNDGEDETPVVKRVVPIVLAGAPAGREPRVVQLKAQDAIVLPPKSATMDDGQRLGELLFGAPPAGPLPLTLGFLELTSRQPLNVVAVYTATGLQDGPVSIAVETIAPRVKRGPL